MFYIYFCISLVFLLQWSILDIPNSQMRSLVLSSRAGSELVWNCCIGPLTNHEQNSARKCKKIWLPLLVTSISPECVWMGLKQRTSRDDDSLQLRGIWKSHLEGTPAEWRERKSSYKGQNSFMDNKMFKKT